MEMVCVCVCVRGWSFGCLHVCVYVMDACMHAMHVYVMRCDVINVRDECTYVRMYVCTYVCMYVCMTL